MFQGGVGVHRTDSTGAGGAQEASRLASQREEGGPQGQVGCGGAGWSCLWGLLGRGLLPHLPRLLAPLLHISTFRASPPRMPNLAHAICRLSSEIGTKTKAECITSPQLPLLGERGGTAGGQGTSGQPSTFSPVFLLTLPASVPEARAGASRSSLMGPRARTRASILGSPQGRAGGQMGCHGPG